MEVSEIYKLYGSRLGAFIRSRVGQEADAEDLLQDVFVRIHTSIYQLSDRTRLESWLFAVTRNMITDYYRKKKPVSDSLPDLPAEDVHRVNLSECMWPFVEQLPEKYRVAVRYCDIEGHTQQEFANHAGISLPGAKSRLQRGRKMLKSLFEACCHIETDKYGNVIEHIPRGKCGCA